MSVISQRSSFALTQQDAPHPWQLMAHRPAPNAITPAFAIGQAIRAGFDAATNARSSQNSLPPVQEFSSLHQTLFKNDTIRIVYAPLDPGVDDTANVLGLKASVQSGALLQFEGFVPQTGNAVLEDTEKNTACALKQTESHDPIYPGAIAPLGIQNNKTATKQYLKQTEAFGFYGNNGWPVDRVSICPQLDTKIQCQQGHAFVAQAVVQAQADKPITIVSSAALTTLAQSLMEIEQIALQKSIPVATLTQNIACISMMAGCVDPTTCGPNAPFTKPDFSKAANCTTSTDPDFNPPCKISEANLFADPEAAQYVFSFCERYNIAIVLSPLDLTQQTQLLWTPLQTTYLESIATAPAQALAKIAKPVPVLDQPCFPPYNGTTYPMHDAFSGYALTHPEFFQYTRYAFSVGSVGQLIVNETASEDQKNVYVLSVPQERQDEFWPTVLPEYKNFKNKTISRSSFTQKITAGVVSAVTAVTASFFSASSHSGTIIDQGQHCKRVPLTWGDIGLLAGSALTVAGIFALVVYGCYKAKTTTSKEESEEKQPLV